MIRIGIVGAGFGAKAHLPALRAHTAFDVVAVASPHSAQHLADEGAIPYAFPSCEAMLAGVQLDAVVVASPPFAHHDDVRAAISAGKHVLCEKPFALNLAQAQSMLDAASRANIVAGVAHEFRYVPQRLAIKELLVHGHLAAVRAIEVTHLMGFLRVGSNPRRGWWFDKSSGGGMAGALLSHAIDTATWLAGREPVHTLGLLRTANHQRADDDGAFSSDVDDGAFALLDYGDGLVARLSSDATTAVESYTLAVHAEGRTAVASGANLTDLRLFSIDDDETNELDCAPSAHKRFASISSAVPYLMDLYDDFAHAIVGSANTLPSFHDALATQRVLAAIGYGN